MIRFAGVIRIWGTRASALTLAVFISAVVAAPAAAVVVHRSKGHFLGVIPRRGVSPASIPGSVAATRSANLATPSTTGSLDYNGGPVVHSSAPYLIFWTPSGESMPSGSESLLERYFTDVAADSGDATNVFAVDRQFTDSTGFADYHQTFSTSSQVIVDQNSYPKTDAANCQDAGEPTCLTDAQLQKEVQRLITASGLPNDGSASASELVSNAPIYFVVLPPDVNVCFGGGGGGATSCSDNVFCAYHSSFTDTNNDSVLYAAIPSVLALSDPKGCQADGNNPVQEPNGNVADVMASYTSHEDNEATTDPLGTGWWDTATGNEDGDNCTSFGPFDPGNFSNPNAFTPTLGGSAGAGNLYNQLINGDQYYTQSEWSNGNGNCELRPSAGTIAPSVSLPPGPYGVGSTVSFDPTSSTSTNSISSETLDFGDGSMPAFHVGSPRKDSHAYMSAGVYDVKLTLVDNRGNLATSSQLVQVYNYPSARFGFSLGQPAENSSVSFDGSASTDPDPGVTISSYSWNFGDGGTATGPIATHVYGARGTYTVTLAVTNSVGLSNSTSQRVTVTDEPPNASFAVATAHPAAAVAIQFDGSASSDPDGSISSYSWSFGDGGSGTGSTPRHTYAAPGTYVVTLTVFDSSGLTSTTSRQLVVVPGSRITKISVLRRRHGTFLLITVDGAGNLSVGQRRFAVRSAGTSRVRIVLTRAQQSTFRQGHRLKLKVHVAFTPSIGVSTRRVVTVRLHR